MKVQITEKHIWEGQMGSCNADPIALAMRDAGYIGPWVSPTEIHFTDKEFGFRHTTPMPGEVLKFVQDFDAGRSVQPFEFEMED